MSRKRKRQTQSMEEQTIQMPSSNQMMDTAKQTLDSAVSTVNNNKVLIGSIAGACGAAIFLLLTESGKRVRNGIQTRTVDLYDWACDQASNGMDRVRDLTQNLLGSSQAEHSTRRTKRAA